MRDPARCKRVAELGCLACKTKYMGETAAEIHHVRYRRQGEAMGVQKRSDAYIVPLCSIHHRCGDLGTAIHAGRRSWEKAFGSEQYFLDMVSDLLGEN